MIVSIKPERATRSDALSAYVDYGFYTLRQHQEDLKRIRREEWIAMMAAVRSSQYRHQLFYETC